MKVASTLTVSALLSVSTQAITPPTFPDGPTVTPKPKVLTGEYGIPLHLAKATDDTSPIGPFETIYSISSTSSDTSTSTDERPRETDLTDWLKNIYFPSTTNTHSFTHWTPRATSQSVPSSSLVDTGVPTPIDRPVVITELLSSVLHETTTVKAAIFNNDDPEELPVAEMNRRHHRTHTHTRTVSCRPGETVPYIPAQTLYDWHPKHKKVTTITVTKNCPSTMAVLAATAS